MNVMWLVLTYYNAELNSFFRHKAYLTSDVMSMVIYLSKPTNYNIHATYYYYHTIYVNNTHTILFNDY